MTSTTGRRLSIARGLFATLATFAACTTALAQALPRNIPDDAKRATVRYLQDMNIAVNDAPMRLAPGAQIRDRNNFIIVPSALQQDGALADLVIDPDGNVFRVWLLTAEEAARSKSKPAQ